MQCCPCASVATAKDGEDEEEEVDDVEVEIEGGKDVFLRGNGVLVFAPHHHLSVKHEVLKHKHIWYQTQDTQTQTHLESNTRYSNTNTSGVKHKILKHKHIWYQTQGNETYLVSNVRY